MFAWLKEYLGAIGDKAVEVNLEISYFNSSSSKVLMNFFDILEEAVDDGKKIVVNWYYHEENETAMECGEEFMEDLNNLPFNLKQISDGD